MIYRPFLTSVHSRSRPPKFPVSPLDVCVAAANSSARILEVQLRAGISNVPNLLAISHVCAAILSIKLWDLREREKLQVKVEEGAENARPQVQPTQELLIRNILIFVKALQMFELKWESAAHHL